MDDASSDDREIRAARNQALFRLVNEKLKALNEGFEPLLNDFAIACECSEATCVQMLSIEPAAYEEVRRNPRTFVVAVGHVDPVVERPVSETDRYVIVENIGVAARVAEETDPRSTPAGS
jgi:hypothetical protein